MSLFKNSKLIVAYIPNKEKSYKFLCEYNKNYNSYLVIHSYNSNKDFNGCRLTNTKYKIRIANEEDISLAIIDNI